MNSDKESLSDKKLDKISKKKSIQPPLLLITGYSSNVKKPKLYKFLKTFGDVTNILSHKDYISVQYRDEDSFQKLLKNPLRFENDYLKVTVGQTNSTIKKRRRSTNEIAPEHDDLVANLKQITDANEQLHIFMTEVQLSVDEIKRNYCLLCEHLEIALGSVFKNCQAMPFGSTVTELAFKGSDLDVFIYVPYPPKNRTDLTVPLPVFCVNEARKPLYRRSDLFTRIITISKAKTPIVKCIHKPTGIHCDINFKNMFGVRNTGLIRFLLGTDLRLRPTMMIIKYWAKLNEITGNGKFTNYSLVMLFIYYLQQESVHILPSIADLQRDPDYDDIIEGWNAGYNSNLNQPITNTDGIPCLLYGFFKYYSSYEFSMKVISPFIGKDITKTSFIDYEQLPEVFWRYKKLLKDTQIAPLNTDACICVQDPFEHNHNLTKSVSVGLIKHFQNCCTFASEICEDILKTRALADLLPRIFVEKYIEKNIKINHQITILAGTIVMRKTETIPLGVNYEEYLRKYWYEKVNEILLVTLKKVFKFELSVSKDEHGEMTLATNCNDHGNVIERFIIHCTSYYILHMGRKQISKKMGKSLEATTSYLKHEIDVSDYIMNTTYAKQLEQKDSNTNRSPVLEIDIVFTACKKPTRIVLDIKNRNPNSSNRFVTFVQYFERLPMWIDKFLQETN